MSPNPLGRARGGRPSAAIRALSITILLAIVCSAAPERRHRNRPKTSNAVVARWMSTLTLRQKIAQLIVVPFRGISPNPRSQEYRKLVRLIRDVRVGGLILVNWYQGRVVQRAEPIALASFLNRMQSLARIPLVVAGDFERGASMRVDSTTVFPHAMAFGATWDPAATRYEGEVTARESRALGVHWVFFPVADLNNNPENPIINIRSFGENPQDVAAHVKAFLDGARSDSRNRILTTVKHFPGHGDTATDTHQNMATILADRAHLEQVELVPFRAAIDHGVDGVMTAHIAVPALDAPDVPATLSSAVLTKLLREELGFHGLIVTDALEMGGIAKGFSTGQAAVRALEAGADVLVMPSDPEAALSAVLAAVQQGRLSRKRVEESVTRILTAKQRLGLDRGHLVKVNAIAKKVNLPESNQRAQEIADRAITLIKNERDLIPLRNPSKTCFWGLSENPSSTQGQTFIQEIRKRIPGAEIGLIDASMEEASLDKEAGKANSCESVVLAAFVTVSAYRSGIGLSGGLPKFVATVIGSGKPVALIALGSPYLLRNFSKASACLAAFSTVVPSEIAVVKTIFGEVPISGRLPVTIPELARYGDGIRSPAASGVH